MLMFGGVIGVVVMLIGMNLEVLLKNLFIGEVFVVG